MNRVLCKSLFLMSAFLGFGSLKSKDFTIKIKNADWEDMSRIADIPRRSGYKWNKVKFSGIWCKIDQQKRKFKFVDEKDGINLGPNKEKAFGFKINAEGTIIDKLTIKLQGELLKSEKSGIAGVLNLWRTVESSKKTISPTTFKNVRDGTIFVLTQDGKISRKWGSW